MSLIFYCLNKIYSCFHERFSSISIPRNLVDVSEQLFPILVKDTLLMDIFLPDISQCLCRGFIMIYLVLPAFRDNLFVQNHVYK